MKYELYSHVERLILTSKARPSVCSTFRQKLLHSSSLGSREKKFSCIGIVKVDLPRIRLCVVNEISLLEVAAKGEGREKFKRDARTQTIEKTVRIHLHKIDRPWLYWLITRLYSA